MTDEETATEAVPVKVAPKPIVVAPEVVLTPEAAATINVRTCEVCGRSTALDACAHCGHNPSHDAERAAARLAAA